MLLSINKIKSTGLGTLSSKKKSVKCGNFSQVGNISVFFLDESVPNDSKYSECIHKYDQFFMDQNSNFHMKLDR